MFVNLTRARSTYVQDDTDSPALVPLCPRVPFLVNLAHVHTINRTADYETYIKFTDDSWVCVEESLADIMELIIKLGLSTPTVLLGIKEPTPEG